MLEVIVAIAAVFAVENYDWRTFSLLWPRSDPHTRLVVYLPCEQNGPELEFLWFEKSGSKVSHYFRADRLWERVDWNE